MLSKFQSSPGKRTILLVEDEIINQEILKAVLEENYTVWIAETGDAAKRIITSEAAALSLVLLDLNLPDMHGLDILRWMKADAELARIPVIVETADDKSEVESLLAGANDFLQKPYSMPEVVRARILRTIELAEDRVLIQKTERDHLTALFTPEYFFRYAEQFDHFHPDASSDAILVDINRFHLINERYGRETGDSILREIGRRIREDMLDLGGIACRQSADTFLVYCPHIEDPAKVLDSTYLSFDGIAGKIRLRIGIYPDVDKTIPMEQRFARAKSAADSVKSRYTDSIGVYDKTLYEREVYAEQLLESFHDAIEHKQFLVYYQPKFDIHSEVFYLSSAEALVRWQHPSLGMISPGVFIPLFEGNGLIRVLDEYVWREAARQVRVWKDQFGFTIPVSVNVSRIDLLDPDFIPTIDGIVQEHGISHDQLILEITESAYSQDEVRIIDIAKTLRSLGFRIEMDDFGSGYSSLNMLLKLPIDALKIDMMFIRGAFADGKNTKMLETVFELAQSLNYPTIAEGVETAEQLFTLKGMGCDIVQGYYFSKPVPAAEFEPFLTARKEMAVREPQKREAKDSKNHADYDRFIYNALHDPVTGLYNASGFELLLRDADQKHIAVITAILPEFHKLSRTEADKAAWKVRDALRNAFRSVDLLCRVRDDRFIVIVTRTNHTMQKLIEKKIEQINHDLEKERLHLETRIVFGDQTDRLVD